MAGAADRGVRGGDRRARGGAAGVPHVHRRRAAGRRGVGPRDAGARVRRGATRATRPTRRRWPRWSARCSVQWRDAEADAGARAAGVRAAAAAAQRAGGGEGGGGHGALRVRAARVAERGGRAIREFPWRARWSGCTRCWPSARSGTPRALNATNTHDTKRSADVRSRLDALSEHAAVVGARGSGCGAGGIARCRRWCAAGSRRRARRTTSSIRRWSGSGRPGRPPCRRRRVLGALRERLTAYILKAVREAKVSTSWTDPDEEYERAVAAFIAGLLDPASPGRYPARRRAARRRGGDDRDVERARRGCRCTSRRRVCRTSIRGTSSGSRRSSIRTIAGRWIGRRARSGSSRCAAACDAGVDGVPPLEMLRRWRDDVADGTLKLYLTTRLLRLRRDDDGGALARGGYVPSRRKGRTPSG